MRSAMILLFSGITFTAFSQDLSRRARWQASFEGDFPGVWIKSIEDQSPLADVGLKEMDKVLQVNDRRLLTSEDWGVATYAIRANEPTKITYRRGDKVGAVEVRLNELGKETHEGLDTFYEEVTGDYGIGQRTIITKPQGQSGRMPAIMLLQGLSCSTIEDYPGRTSNWAKHITYVVEQSGMVVMRVEKPGVGDSEGDCSQTDFITELEGYRAALRALKSKDYVDPQRIVVYGSSMGSALAPLLANEFELAGVISDGTFFKTWYEHMLEIERRILQMNGDNESAILKKMNEAYIPLYYGMLIQGKAYEEVVKETPSLADYNYHGPQHMYGRPMSYYQQLQKYDLAGEWEKVQAPVRLLYGSNDWIMSEFDNHMIIRVLDRVGHEDHELLIYPGLDHWNTIHQTPDDSFHGRPGKWDPAVPQQVVDWARMMANP